jgi:hypothetical protein
MPEPDKTVRFISKLVQLTQDRKIEWQSAASPEQGTAFLAVVGGRRIRIYKFSKEVPNPDYASYASPTSHVTTSSFGTIFGSTSAVPPKTILRSGAVLEVFDDAGRAAYKFENRTGLSDLYESASYSAAKVDDLMDAVLGKE